MVSSKYIFLLLMHLCVIHLNMSLTDKEDMILVALGVAIGCAAVTMFDPDFEVRGIKPGDVTCAIGVLLLFVH